MNWKQTLNAIKMMSGSPFIAIHMEDVGRWTVIITGIGVKRSYHGLGMFSVHGTGSSPRDAVERMWANLDYLQYGKTIKAEAIRIDKESQCAPGMLETRCDDESCNRSE